MPSWEELKEDQAIHKAQVILVYNAIMGGVERRPAYLQSPVPSWEELKEDQAIHKAQVILVYNAIMGGVERSDQLLKYYSFLWKTIKWYKKLAFHLIDVAILNANVLSFCMSLVKQILQYSSAASSARYQGGRPSTTVHPMPFPKPHPLKREQVIVSAVQSLQQQPWSPTSAGRVRKTGGDEVPLHTLCEHSTLCCTMF
ncbi:hypothetical protein EOD39_8863 [Acipenser ruthenus]|uniref:PiggyBac transposable element-derived protein domain-containing protein n=1 Tax=Acipenser ruthenus TaxID=7906 RepID=A0A444U2E1_ACIRT|nr:hypothetical protein EOD39_8863 [Acipenser ruthenus]